MPTTTRFSVNTPAGSDPNDFAGDMFDIAQAITGKMAGYLEGTHTDRPAANLSKGVFYRVTDNTVNGGWFVSDGTNWVRLTASPFVSWAPTRYLISSNGALSPNTFTASSASYLYRIMPNSEVEVVIDLNGAISGVQQYTALLWTSPIPSLKDWSLSGEAMNDSARVRVEATGGAYGNCIGVFPNGAYNIRERFYGATLNPPVGEWVVDGIPRRIRVNGTYPI